MLRFLHPRRNQLPELQSPPHRVCRCPCHGTRYFSRNGARSFKHLPRATATLRILPMLQWVAQVGDGNRISVLHHLIWTTSLTRSVDYRTGNSASNGLSINTELTSRIRHSSWPRGRQFRRPTELLPYRRCVITGRLSIPVITSA